MKKLSKPVLANPVLMAVIGAPHGVRGEVRVKSHTADPLALGDYGPLLSADGRRFTLAAIRPAGNVAVARFEEIAGREAAEAAKGTELYVERAALPDDLEEDEFYHADLVGLAARDLEGAEIGKVIAVLNFGGGDILELKGPGGTVMVPFTQAAVPEIAPAQGFVRIDPEAAGLADEDEQGQGE